MSRQNHHDVFESRTQFQLERIILFSDAVFAIAITLLVLEIKIPKIEGEFTEKKMVEALAEKLPDFIAFIISFVVIGQFWTTHHRLFGYVNDYTPKLLWLNLLILFWVVLMPFSTYLNMEYGNIDIVWLWYSINLTMISASVYLMWRYVFKNKELCSMYGNKPFMKYTYTRSLTVIALFLIGGLLTLVPVTSIKIIARFTFLLIIPALIFIKKRYQIKLNKKTAH
jgi:uncharacterized membrane protein